MRMTRSQLYANAVSRFVKQHDGEAITKRLNAVYEQNPEGSQLSETLKKLQARSVDAEQW
jgi:hypothetical protein